MPVMGALGPRKGPTGISNRTAEALSSLPRLAAQRVPGAVQAASAIVALARPGPRVLAVLSGGVSGGCSQIRRDGGRAKTSAGGNGLIVLVFTPQAATTVVLRRRYKFNCEGDH